MNTNYGGGGVESTDTHCRVSRQGTVDTTVRLFGAVQQQISDLPASTLSALRDDDAAWTAFVAKTSGDSQ